MMLSVLLVVVKWCVAGNWVLARVGICVALKWGT